MMITRTFDNEKYKKIKYLEIGICLGLFVIGVLVCVFGESFGYRMLGALVIFLANGMVIQWFLETLYIKKIKDENAILR